jgi:hypothetical protein
MVRISLVLALTPLYLYDSTFRNMCAVPNIIIIIIIIIINYYMSLNANPSGRALLKVGTQF